MNNSSQEQDFIFKYILVGESNVGKTSLLLRFVDDAFSEKTINTLDSKNKVIILKDKTVKIQIWDTAGQERFRTITSSFYRSAHGIFIVYDVTDQESFDNLNQWLIEVRRYTCEDIPVMLIANKIDLNAQVVIDKLSGENWAKENKVSFIECSAKTSENVSLAFETLTQQLLDKNCPPPTHKKLKVHREKQSSSSLCSLL